MFGTSLLIVGSESLLAERAVNERVAQARKEFPDAEFHDVSAGELGEGRIYDILGGSLFASRYIVVVRDLANLPVGAAPQLIEAATRPGEELFLVLVHGGGNKGKSTLEALKKAKLELIKVDPVKANNLPGFLHTEARRRHIRIDQPAIEILIQSVGTDLRSLVAALGQLASDNDGAPVTQEVVRRFFSGRAEVTGFAVADEVMSGRIGSALEKLRWALETGCTPVQVTSALASSLRAMGKFFDARRSSLPDRELGAQIGVPFWKLKDLRTYARSWRPDGVAEGLLAVANADRQVKGAAVNAGFALEQMLLEVEAARTGQRRG